MVLRLVLAAGLMLNCLPGWAVKFTTIDRTTAVVARFDAAEPSVVDVMLMLDAHTEGCKDYYLRFQFVIGQDTLTDHLLVNGSNKGIIKRLRLDASESLTVLMYLHDSGLSSLNDISGDLTIVHDPALKPADENSLPSFTGTVWNRQQIPLFRVVKNDSTQQTLSIKYDLTENFEYDKLYFNLKVISPSLSIQVLPIEVEVNSGSGRSLKQEVLSIDITEVKMNEKGTYYLQIIQRMGSKRVNGIKKVYYGLE